MGNNPTDIWAWTVEDAERLKQEGGPKQAILENYADFWEYYHNDHAAAEQAISAAIDAARSTGELRWELHLRHWRLQLWLTQKEAKRMLPEAVDLLSLAVDERVRDVPQRICAYHDVVDCYSLMDKVGYYQEIVENSQEILSQLPQKHPCATCARRHIALTAAASGKAEEAEKWQALCEANLNERRYPGICGDLAATQEYLENWDRAEQLYRETVQLARKERQGDTYVDALLGITRCHLGKGDINKALKALQDARRAFKYQDGTALQVQMLFTEGLVARACNETNIAIDFLTRSAAQYLQLGCYRDAAEAALTAAEEARTKNQPEAEEALQIAAQAVGQMPPTSKDVYERLAALGKEPVDPASIAESADETGAEDQALKDRKERQALQEMLDVNLTHKNMQGVATALYRIGRWHGIREEHRAAVDYLILNAVLERWMRLPMHDREDALGVLQHLRNQLPDGTVATALKAAASEPPTWLQAVLEDMSLQQWRRLVQEVSTEVEGRPVVEPEAREDSNQGRFQSWLSHCASMTALLVRFKDQADPIKREQWASVFDGYIEQAQQATPDAPDLEPLISLNRGFAALARGTDFDEVVQMVLPPFQDIITRIGQVAQAPVWFHPGSSPLDFLIEQAAQKAVEALRMHDDYRPQRLVNLAFRYELMNLDLRQHEELQPIAHFLDALSALVLADGASLPEVEPPLERPFDEVLKAVYSAGQQ